MTNGRGESVSDLVATALEVDVVASRSVSGGDFASAHRLELADGRVVFAKTHADPPPNFFSTEAAGLQWLREAAQSDVLVPEVLHVSDAPPLLVLPWIDEGSRPDEATFGRGLAALHASGFETFGRPDGQTTGSLALPNDPCASWAEFLAERRLLPLARLASDRHSLSANTVRRIEALASDIDRIAPPTEPPSLLHGDLWAGNRLVDSDRQSWLIDPACFGGHREFDLAMMRLFGGYGEAAFDAYANAFPLVDGWRDRIALHQLPPLIVHAIKFGGGYPEAVARCLDQY